MSPVLSFRSILGVFIGLVSFSGSVFADPPGGGRGGSNGRRQISTEPESATCCVRELSPEGATVLEQWCPNLRTTQPGSMSLFPLPINDGVSFVPFLISNRLYVGHQWIFGGAVVPVSNYQHLTSIDPNNWTYSRVILYSQSRNRVFDASCRSLVSARMDAVRAGQSDGNESVDPWETLP